jgi:hypothetical protein
MKMTNKTPKREKYLLFILLSLSFLGLGSVGNALVIKNNDCLMPVYKNYQADFSPEHFNYINKSEVNYWFLSDFIKITLPKDYQTIYSPGDLLMLLSFFLSMTFSFLYLKEVKKSKNAKKTK